MLDFELPVAGHRVLVLLWTSLALGFALFGCNSLWMVLGALRKGGLSQLSASAHEREKWPVVTVQLPLFNEIAMAARVIDACAALDYPPDKLEIQVLDDSSDDTQRLARERVLHWRRQGVDIQYLHRERRSEYKAGALQWGADRARGEYFAIFDADFQPEPDFLRLTIGHLLRPENARVGFLQTRWHVMNTEESVVAKCSSLAVNGHFAVEVEARRGEGGWIGFNGSAGVWRRACIEDPAVGGWSGSTLCEDMHISYLAQLAGWKGEYMPHVAVKSDAPVRIAELRLQQFRWAKGSVQVLTRLASRIVRFHRMDLRRSVQALFHMGSYLQQALLLGLIILSLPLTLLDVQPPVWTAFVMALGLGPLVVVGVGQWRLFPTSWWRSLPALMTLSLVGMGLCLANAVAVSEALRGKTSPFQRTPKGTDSVRNRRLYAWDTRPLEDRMLHWEWLLTFYCLVTLILALENPITGVWPISLTGLCSIGLLACWTQWDRKQWARRAAAGPRGLASTDAKRIRT